MQRRLFQVLIVAFILFEALYALFQFLWYNTTLSNSFETFKYLFWCILYFGLFLYFKDRKLRIVILCICTLNLLTFITFMIPNMITTCSPSTYLIFFKVMITEM